MRAHCAGHTGKLLLAKRLRGTSFTREEWSPAPRTRALSLLLIVPLTPYPSCGVEQGAGLSCPHSKNYGWLWSVSPAREEWTTVTTSLLHH